MNRIYNTIIKFEIVNIKINIKYRKLKYFKLVLRI
jgi:hypothetical protein